MGAWVLFLHSSSMAFEPSVTLCLLEVHGTIFWVIECFEVRRSLLCWFSSVRVFPIPSLLVFFCFCFGKHGEHFGRILSSHLGMYGEHFVCGAFNLYKMGSNLKKGFKVVSMWFFNLWDRSPIWSFYERKISNINFRFHFDLQKNLIWIFWQHFWKGWEGKSF
jgi:hypothetical protein